MNFIYEHEIENVIANFLSEHQITFDIEKKSQYTNYRYDFFLHKGLRNAKLDLDGKNIDLKTDGPVAIEIKRRLLFDTIQRYEKLYSEILAPKKEVSSFILVYVDGPLSSLESALLNKKFREGFYVLSLPQFLRLQIEGKVDDYKIDSESYDWKKDRDKTLNMAKNSLQDNDFSFFLGAGVSMSAKLPSWWNLLEGMMAKRKQNQLHENDITQLNAICYNSSIVLGRFIRLLLETKSNEEEYYNVLHDALYGGVSSFDSPLISEICALISNRKEQAKSIITYNFDDVMERALNERGIENYSIFGMNQPQSAFPIYHVHGFIPFDNSEVVKCVPILSEEEYHRVYANSYNWSNVEQIHALSRTTCIFIGLSMRDPNLRRLLDIAIRDSEHEARHYVFLPCIKDFTEGDDAYIKNNEAMRIQREIFLELGLRVIWYEDYNKQLPKLVGELK